MKLLANKQQIEKYLKISFHRKDEDVNRFIREVLLFDIKPLVCEGFFLDITNESTTNYNELIDGGNYTHKGVEYNFEGLIAVIAYFFYARYIYKSHQADTPFGIVQKKYNDSEPLSSIERRDMNKIYKQQAGELWKDVVIYLNRNLDKYPEWENCNGCGAREVKGKLKISVF